MHEAVAAISATGVSPIVRIAANEGWMVKRKFFQRYGVITQRDLARTLTSV